MNPDLEAERASLPEPAPVALWRRRLRLALGVAFAVGAAWLVVSASGGFGDAVSALGHVDPWWLIPAVACEATAYVLSGARLRRLAGARADLSVASATGIELVVNGLGLLTPASPAEGLALGAAELSRRGLDRRHVTLTLLFTQWFSTRVFLLVNALNLLFVLVTRDLPVDSTWPLVVAPIVLIALAGTAIVASRPAATERLALIVGALRFWKPRPPTDQRRNAGARFHSDAMAVVGSPRQRIVLVCLSAASMLADVSCLYFVLIAAGAHVGFDVAILATGAAAAGAIVPFLPGGLGVVEAIIPAVVHWYGPPFTRRSPVRSCTAPPALSFPPQPVRSRSARCGHDERDGGTPSGRMSPGS